MIFDAVRKVLQMMSGEGYGEGCVRTHVMADVDDGDRTAVEMRMRRSRRAWRALGGGLERHGDSLNEGDRVEESPAVTHAILVFVFGSWVCQRPVRILTNESEFGSRAPTYGFNIHVNYFCKALAAYREELFLCLASEGPVHGCLALWV